ncbi:MAG TPA: Crp/Fnr family transcriptional regulator, partial [Devosia sp.]|nr:Crp/Fnr family transcriptional regulator [Devosia sp.]
MSHYLIAKLERYIELPAADKRVLETLAASNVKTLKPKQDLVRTGDKPIFVNLLLSGWAARYIDLEDGRRQIVGVILPGDICDLRMFMLQKFDHSIGACTTARFAQVPRQELLDRMAEFPAIERALAWNSLVEEAMARAWIANVGQRTALERLAHLFVELFLRLQAVGLAHGNSCEFPLTQEHLADA